MTGIILASSSPRRKELLKTAGVEFEIIVKEVDESVPDGINPQDAAVLTATKKASAVAEGNKEAVVIGADTIVVCNSKILGKPKNEEHAKEMLRMLSGIEHEVITGVCLIKGEKIKSFAKVSKVRFYELTDAEIENYVATKECMDKAGAYGIQGLGCTLVESIEGDYFNIVGLPVAAVVKEIAKM